VKQRLEIRDGKPFVVTTLPADKRLTPSATNKRQLFQALSTGEKKAFINDRIRTSKKRRRRKRKKP
jgi:hypothetical protein